MEKKMKNILVIGLSNEMGGTENYIYNLIQRLDPKQYTLDFLIIDDGGRTPYEDEINTFYSDGRNHFYYCPNLKKYWVSGKQWLKNFYDEHRYDVIYMNATTSARVVYCKYAVDKLHIPLITHSHRSDGKRFNHYIYRRYTRNHSVFKLACSTNAANWMFGKKEKNYALISNGIISEKFSFNQDLRNDIRNKLNISSDKFVIGHVGRFSEEKNHRHFVQLAKILDDKYVFLLIGEGPLKEEIKDLVIKEGLENRFYILGATKDVNKYYSAMDVFMMPSFNEGLPIVSVEAQCNGLRCIFSDTISKENNISGNCVYLLLSDLISWKNTLEKEDFKRYDGICKIREAGFDMEHSASIVDKLFSRAVKK